jgi:hypothetical protein
MHNGRIRVLAEHQRRTRVPQENMAQASRNAQSLPLLAP